MYAGKLLIFIPMYNCEKQIPRVLGRLERLAGELPERTELLIVDNRSRDESLSAAGAAMRALPCPAKLVQNRENYGLGGSHKVAFAYALDHGFDGVAVLHGDDQGDPADLLPQLSRAADYDSLLGSRFSRGSVLTNYSAFRVLGNRVFNAVFSLCTRCRVEDLGAGLNYYAVPYLASRFYLGFPNDLTFNVWLLLYGIHAHSRFTFFPLSWREEDQVSNAKLFTQSRRMLGLLGRWLFARRRLFSGAENEEARIDYRFDVVAEHRPGEVEA